MTKPEITWSDLRKSTSELEPLFLQQLLRKPEILLINWKSILEISELKNLRLKSQLCTRKKIWLENRF